MTVFLNKIVCRNSPQKCMKKKKKMQSENLKSNASLKNRRMRTSLNNQGKALKKWHIKKKE